MTPENANACPVCHHSIGEHVRVGKTASACSHGWDDGIDDGCRCVFFDFSAQAAPKHQQEGSK